MLQIFLLLAVFIAVIFPAGKYLYHIATGRRTFADPVCDRVDGVILRLCGVDGKGMNWKQYAAALLATNAVMGLAAYLILRIQFLQVLNPNGIGAMETSLSLNTIISFMTNTDLQHYSGESGLSYLSQMGVIIFLMFASAATGFAVLMAFARGLSGKAENMGNFYADIIRVTTRVLLPLPCIRWPQRPPCVPMKRVEMPWMPPWPPGSRSASWMATIPASAAAASLSSGPRMAP